MGYRVEDLPERIASKIVVDPDTGCWIWNGCLDSSSYPHGKHREIYELLVGVIPNGFDLDHLSEICPYTFCANPEHLKPLSKEEHKRRTRERKILRHFGLFGHEFRSTYDNGICIECANNEKRRRRQRSIVKRDSRVAEIRSRLTLAA